MKVGKKGLLLAFGLMLALCACDNHQKSGPASGVVGTPPPPAGAPAALPQTALMEKSGATAETESSTITRINEDGSESVEDTSSDTGAHNPILTAVASSLSGTAAAATTLAAPAPWQEG